MRISGHITVGVVGAVPVYFLTGNLVAVVSYFLANSLIDLDHLFDIFYDHGLVLSISKFLRICYTSEVVHFIVIFHSFEVVILSYFLIYLSVDSPFYYYCLGISLGITCHLLSDILFNRSMPLRYYFFFNRLKKKFKFYEMFDDQV